MDAETLALAALEICERCGDDDEAIAEAMARLKEQVSASERDQVEGNADG